MLNEVEHQLPHTKIARMTWDTFYKHEALSGTDWDLANLTSLILRNYIRYNGKTWQRCHDRHKMCHDEVLVVIMKNLVDLGNKFITEKSVPPEYNTNIQFWMARVKSVDRIEKVMTILKSLLS